MNNNNKLEEYINFNSISKNIELNQEKIINIFEAYSKAKKILKLLSDLNIEYQISLIGGALRDLITSKTIKDYDFLINIPDKKRIREIIAKKFGVSKDFYYEITKEFNKNLTNFQIERDVDDIVYNPNRLIYRENTKEFQRLKEFIEEKETEFLFKKIYEINKNKDVVFFEMGNRREIEDSYVFVSITSIIKFENLDLILTEVKNQNYVSNFDFEICKSFLPLICEENISKENFINYTKENIIVSKTMIEDVVNKTITYSVDKFTEKEIERSINKHYYNIKEKYKEYEFLFNGKKTNKIFAENLLLKQIMQKKEDIKVKKKKI